MGARTGWWGGGQRRHLPTGIWKLWRHTLCLHKTPIIFASVFSANSTKLVKNVAKIVAAIFVCTLGAPKHDWLSSVKMVLPPFGKFSACACFRYVVKHVEYLLKLAQQKAVYLCAACQAASCAHETEFTRAYRGQQRVVSWSRVIQRKTQGHWTNKSYMRMQVKGQVTGVSRWAGPSPQVFANIYYLLYILNKIAHARFMSLRLK